MDNQYEAGREAAYAEVNAVVHNPAHQKGCPGCRACKVMEGVANKVMATLADKMTQEEYFTFGLILARIGMAEGRDKEA